MQSFEQTDGRVILRSGGEQYLELEADFAIDSGAPAPSLPAGFIGRIYVLGERHFLTTGKKYEPQDLSWAPGDAIIAKFSQIVSARDSRENLPISLGQYKSDKQTEIRNLALTRLERDHDRTDIQALTFADQSDLARVAYATLAAAVKTEKARVVALIGSRSSRGAVDTAFNSLSLPT